MMPYWVHTLKVPTEKCNSTTRRVIIDFSWPKFHSVNTAIDKNSNLGTDFVLTTPTIGHTTNELKCNELCMCIKLMSAGHSTM